jgi:hypothetical protein
MNGFLRGSIFSVISNGIHGAFLYRLLTQHLFFGCFGLFGYVTITLIRIPGKISRRCLAA